jgi:hypothetical protein
MGKYTDGCCPKNEDFVFYAPDNTIPTGNNKEGVDTVVLLNGDRYDWTGVSWIKVPANDDFVQYTGNTTVPTAVPPKGVDTAVLSDGTRYEWNGTVWIEVSTGKGFRVVQNLVAGNNAITHNLALGLTPVIVETRDNTTGALIATRVVTEATNSITINATVAYPNVRISVYPLYV